MRRTNDFYPTPEWATSELLNAGVPIGGNILEPCAGDLAIANVLQVRAGLTVTNDIDLSMPTIFHQNIMSDWRFGEIEFDWIVTNPPFNRAPEMVPIFFEKAREGIALLLRKSYSESCLNRDVWLQEKQEYLAWQIYLPRISFTGDGKTDNVSCDWFVWTKEKAQGCQLRWVLHAR